MPDYFTIHRDYTRSDDWLAEQFTRGQAWVDLISLARWKPGTERIRGILIDIERGQMCWSEKGLASRWRWSRGKVRRFLDELEMRHQIERKQDNKITVITVVNYNLYQLVEGGDGTSNGHKTGQQTVHQTDFKQDNKRTRKNKVNKVNKGNINNPPINPPKNELNFANWIRPLTPEEIQTINANRSKKKQAPLSQLVIDRTANQIGKAMQAGHSFEDCIDTWLVRGWGGFMADYMENNSKLRKAVQRREESHQERAERVVREMEGITEKVVNQ